MKMSANRSDRVVDHPTRCEGQWNAITAITRLTGEHPALVSPPSRTKHAKFSAASPFDHALVLEYGEYEALLCGIQFTVRESRGSVTIPRDLSRNICCKTWHTEMQITKITLPQSDSLYNQTLKK